MPCQEEEEEEEEGSDREAFALNKELGLRESRLM